MYIHIGNGYVVRDGEVAGIFDIDTCSIGRRAKLFFAKNESEGKIISAAEDLPKSFVPVSRGGKRAVIISGVAAATLKKRAETPFSESGY